MENSGIYLTVLDTSSYRPLVLHQDLKNIFKHDFQCTCVAGLFICTDISLRKRQEILLFIFNA